MCAEDATCSVAPFPTAAAGLHSSCTLLLPSAMDDRKSPLSAVAPGTAGVDLLVSSNLPYYTTTH